MAEITYHTPITTASVAQVIANLSEREDAYEVDLDGAIGARDVDSLVLAYENLAAVREATARFLALRVALDALTDADLEDLERA